MAHERNPEPTFYDARFRQKGKQGRYCLVDAPQLESVVADVHTHLQSLSKPEIALARCAIHKVGFLCTAVDIYEDGSATFDMLDSWCFDALHIARELSDRTLSALSPCVPRVRIAVGCHPHNAQYYSDELEAALRRRLADTRVCAVGEIGLDYHYDLSPRKVQRRVFRRQLKVAKETGLPVVLHVREAYDDALAIMQDEGFPEAGVLLHCFTLDWETLKPWIDGGCFVSFGGSLTFKSADEVRDAAARTPLSHLLTETDAPYMTPEPMRGTACGPAHVIFTAKRLAQVRGCASGEERKALLKQLFDNACGLLNRSPTSWQTMMADMLDVHADFEHEGM